MNYYVLRQGEVLAKLRYAEDAAAFVGLLGRGAVVRVNGRIVWREGEEFQRATESYDDAGDVMRARVDCEQCAGDARPTTATHAAHLRATVKP